MKLINTTTLRHALLASIAWSATTALADDNVGYCELRPIGRGTLKVYQRNMGTLYVPRDARIGTVIGPADVTVITPDDSNLELRCVADDDGPIHFEAKATRGVHPGPLPPINGQDVNGHVLQTNVPGIGVVMRLAQPFLKLPEWGPIGRNPPLVPFTAFHVKHPFVTGQLLGWRHGITLVKTGDIAPGAHDIRGVLVTGHVDRTFNHVMNYTLLATIIQTQCNTAGQPVNPSPVELGEWSKADFTHVGFKTPLKPFQISLTNCQVDPDDPDNLTTATIELNGINGSGPIEANGENVFSLTDDSDARGIGIQVLYQGNPMPLDTELPLTPVQGGSTLLNFQARFYQTEPSSAVRAGNAKGALKFTLRYR
ncbi:fimbrial protein [Pseudomonas vlassakiae]|uniref:fimbrial protein n=1 Tax=Pseudomonas TaxID=286 RepID=UPI000C1A257C|nr:MULTISPECIES: fimbrial protein [unclassified Pseudomonas]AXQ49108.1 type 1 fimbrial protein [Stenotrophomonas rhizophila]PIK77869.1 fimbrial protein [Pseudomonas sp. 382]